MIYHKLIIHNIASIEQAELDFENGLLYDNDIFLITGETGVGKSTILDAICLALYNDAPRLEAFPKTKFDDDSLTGGKKDSTLKDPRLLMRRGTDEAMASLDFEGNDGKNYRIEWTVKRKGRNAKGLNLVKRCLYDSEGNAIAEKSTEIDNYIENYLVGLNYEEFCRTSMLAQGEFTKFLKADDNEKASILEKMTSSDIYSKIGVIIYNKTQEAETAVKTLEITAKAQQLLETQQIEEKKNRLQEIKKNVTTLTEEQTVVSSKKKWIDDVKAQQISRTQIEKSLQEQKQISESDEVDRERRSLKAWDDTSEIRGVYNSLKEEQKKFENNKNEKIQLQEKAGEILGGIEFFKNSLAEKEVKYKSLNAVLESQLPLVAMYEQSQTIVAGLKNLSTQQTKIVQNNQKSADLDKQCKALEVDVEAQNKNLSTIETQIKEIEGNIEQKQKEKTAMKAEEIQASQSKLNEKELLVKDAQHSVSECLKQGKKCDEKAENLQKAEETEKSLSENVTTLEKQKVEAEAAYNLQKKLYEKAQVKVGDVVKQLRHNLKSGDTCPVCGQVIDRELSDEHFESLLAPAKAELDKAEVAKKAVDEKWQKAKVDWQTTQNQIKSLQKDVADLTANIQTERKKSDDYLQKLGLQWSDEVQSVLEKTLETIQNEKQTVEAQLVKVNELSKQLDALQKEKDKQRKKRDEMQKNLQELNVKLSNAKNDIEHLKQDTSNLQAEVEKSQSQLTSSILYKEFDWQSDLKNTMNRLTSDAKKYKEDKETYQKLGNEIQSDEKELARLNESMKAFSLENINIVPKKIENLSDAVNELSENRIRLETAASNLSDGIEKKKKQLEEFMSANKEITEELLEELVNWTGAEKTREKLENLKTEIAKWNGQLLGVKKNLDELEKKKPEGLTETDNAESLSERESKITDEIANLNKESGEISAALTENEKKKTVYEKAIGELEEARKKYNNWKRLADMFGAKDGSRFKVIAQSYMLQNLVEAANGYLKTLTDRYNLFCQLGSFAILVEDKYRGGEPRPASTLSGGESFIVSLALALGLSRLAGATVTSNIIFIDEGFGTLSSDALEPVMKTLQNLSQMNGKKVGIISHVEQLKQQIETQIRVTRQSDCSPSEVKVVNWSI